jgi:hypothetical protein
MIGVDLETYCDEFLPVDVGRRSERRDGLRERHRCAPVQDSEGLSGSMIHWHRRDNTRCGELDDLDSERVRETTRRKVSEVCQQRDWCGFGHVVQSRAFGAACNCRDSTMRRRVRKLFAFVSKNVVTGRRLS